MNFCTLVLAFASLATTLVPPVMALRTSVEAAMAVGLLPRDGTCGGVQGLSQCGGNFPSSFCCQTSTTCFGFNNNQSVICCPTKDCAVTNALSCEISAYNATLNPSTPMHLTNLSVQLASCGTNTCCPPGYTCNGNECVLNSLFASLSAATSTAKATSIPTPTAVTVASATAIATSSPSKPPGSSATNDAASSNQFPIPAVLVGVISGLVGGILLAAVIGYLCYRRKSKKKEATDDDDDSSSFGPIAAKVSDPIYVDSTTRTDFLRQARKSRSTQGSTASSPMSRVRSLFSKTPQLSPRRFGDEPLSAGLEEVSTPPRQIRREPSMESIKIYSPPDARYEQRNTTFGDLLKAGGSNSSPPPRPQYMGSPGIVDPRRRGVDTGDLR